MQFIHIQINKYVCAAMCCSLGQKIENISRAAAKKNYKPIKGRVSEIDRMKLLNKKKQ